MTPLGHLELADWMTATQNVRKMSLDQHSKMFDTVAELGVCWQATVLYLLEGMTVSPNSSVIDGVLEASVDAFSSITVATEGLYKLSFVAMRHLIDDTLQAIVAWRDPASISGQTMKSKTPAWSTYNRIVFESPDMQQYRRSMKVLDRHDLVKLATAADAYYWYDIPGSKAAHSHPVARNVALWPDVPTAPQFSHESLEIWENFFCGINYRCLLWVLLAFPQLYHWTQHDPHFLQVHAVDWSTILDPEQQKYFEKQGGNP